MGSVRTEGYSKVSNLVCYTAAGMENGELVLWHPVKILAGTGCVARLWPLFSLAECVARAIDSDPALVN